MTPTVSTPPSHRRPETDRSRSRTRVLILAALLIFGGMVLLGLDNELVSDDWVFVYQGMTADDVGDLFDRGPGEWFSRPVLWLLAYGLAGIFGTVAWPYRILSAGVHLVNCLLLGFLALRLLGVRGPPALSAPRGTRAAMAVATAGLFSVYSLHHEVLYWFSALPEALALLGRLAALVWLARTLQTPSRRDRPLGLALGMAALTAFALGSKESAIVLPVELLLCGLVVRLGTPQADVLERRGRSLFAAILGSGAVAVAWLAWYATAGIERTELTLLELGPLSWLLRLGQAAWRAIAFGKAPDTVPWVGLLLFAWLLLLGLAIYRRRPAVAFGATWLALCLLPYVAITWVGDRDQAVPVLDRYAGIASHRYYYGAGAALALTLAAAALWLIAELEPRGFESWRARRGLRASVLLLLTGVASVHLWHLLGHEREWDRAGQVVELVRIELRQTLVPPLEPGELVCVLGRPDSYRGRYVLRSGITELIQLEGAQDDITVLAPPWVEGAPCTRTLRLRKHPGVVVAD